MRRQVSLQTQENQVCFPLIYSFLQVGYVFHTILQQGTMFITMELLRKGQSSNNRKHSFSLRGP